MKMKIKDIFTKFLHAAQLIFAISGLILLCFAIYLSCSQLELSHKTDQAKYTIDADTIDVNFTNTTTNLDGVHCYILVDKSTGVEYLIFIKNGSIVGITPRYSDTHNVVVHKDS